MMVMWQQAGVIALTLLLASVWFGWHHPVGLLVVLLGTAIGVWQSFTGQAILACIETLRYPPEALEAQTISNWLLAVQTHERKHGILALQQIVDQAPSPLLAKGLGYLADHRSPDWIAHQLDQLATHYQAQWAQTVALLEGAAGLAPTMGILGALAALMFSQGQLTAKDVAPAFTATFLGVGLANLVFLPLANRVQALALAQAKQDEKWINGLLSIQAGEHRLLLLDRVNPEQAVMLS
jgi:chemotaxis protein MotA